MAQLLLIGAFGPASSYTAVSANYQFASQFTALFTESPGTGYILTGTSGTALPSAKWKMVVWADAAGAPGAVLATSNEVTGWAANTTQAFTFATPPSLVKGTKYWLGWICNAATMNVEVTGASGTSRYAAQTYTSGPLGPFAGSSSTSQPCVWFNSTKNGELVSKGLAYGVLFPPKGVSTSKAAAYAVVRPANFFAAGQATISIDATADLTAVGGGAAFAAAAISIDAALELHTAVPVAGGATIRIDAALTVGSIGPVAGDATIAINADASLKKVPALVGSGFVYLQHDDATVEETLATGALTVYTLRAPPRLPLVTDHDRPTTRFLFGERYAQEYVLAEVNPKAPLTRTLRAVDYDPLIYAGDMANPTEEEGVIMPQPPGPTPGEWTVINTGEITQVYAVLWAGDAWIIAGTGEATDVYRFTDPSSLGARVGAALSADVYYGWAIGGGLVVIVCQNNAPQPLVSSDDGHSFTWYEETEIPQSAPPVMGLAYGAGAWVGVGGGPPGILGNVVRSSDGIHYTGSWAGSTALRGEGILWDGTQFVALFFDMANRETGEDLFFVGTSSSGASWSVTNCNLGTGDPAAPDTDNGGKAIAYGNGFYVIAGFTGEQNWVARATSPAGPWTKILVPGRWASSITYANGTWLVTSGDGSVIYSYDDWETCHRDMIVDEGGSYILANAAFNGTYWLLGAWDWNGNRGLVQGLPIVPPPSGSA